MDLISALKTGRKIRNKAFGCYPQWFLCAKSESFTLNTILSEEWEVEEEKLSLSASDIEKALHIMDVNARPMNPYNLCKVLGFK